jgi:ATP adenylyltransferase
LLASASRILETTYNCDGLNVGANLGAAAGAGFAEHVHFHLVPRWRGDVNFMTTVGDIRVIPTHIERSFDELAPEFAKLGAR